MTKGSYFKMEKLKKEFNIAMKNNNIELAKQIDAEIHEILGY